MHVCRLAVPPLLLVALLVSACATDAGSDSASASEPSESASSLGSPEATAGSSGSGAPQPLPAGGEGPVPVPAGRYVSDATGATVTFELSDDAWRALEDLPGVGFALLREFGALTSLSVVAFDGEVFPDPCDPSTTTTIDETPDAFMAWLATVEGVDTGAPSETTIGGAPGLVMDLTTSLPTECTEPPWIFLWVLPTVGDFHFTDGETVRIWAVDASGETVVLAAEADAEADTDAFLVEVDEILATMSIE